MGTTIELAQRPEKDEYGGHFGMYIALVPEGNILDLLSAIQKTTVQFLTDLPKGKSEYRYAPDKWSVKEVIGHMNDTERIMCYRLLCIARADTTPLPGFDQDAYIKNASFIDQTLTELMEEYVSIRNSTISLLRGLPSKAWLRKGMASDVTLSARALAYIIAGHELHHLKILKEKYFN